MVAVGPGEAQTEGQVRSFSAMLSQRVQAIAETGVMVPMTVEVGEKVPLVAGISGKERQGGENAISIRCTRIIWCTGAVQMFPGLRSCTAS